MPLDKVCRKLSHSVQNGLRILTSVASLNNIAHILVDDYINRYLYENPKYQHPQKLNRYEYQVYSQSGEDGIIEEIFNRIGVADQRLVEIGAGDGLENNTAFLLLKNWTGYWIEGSLEHIKRIQQTYSTLLTRRALQVKHAWVTAENIEELLRGANFPREFDLLSIDVDGNDYWIWKAIENHSPRVVVIEYNALYPPNVKWVRKYEPGARWDGTSYFGASLKSLEILGTEKGYRLVGCNFTGINAFFCPRGLG
jgi:hypothetical protein